MEGEDVEIRSINITSNGQISAHTDPAQHPFEYNQADLA